MEEKIFFERENIKISNSRFIVGSKTYAMASVNSVKIDRKNVTPSGGMFALLLVLGILVSIGSLMSLGEASSSAVVYLVLSIAVAVFGFYQLKSIKSVYEYSIVLTTSSGEMAALSSRNSEYIKDVEKALVNAIVFRG